MNREDHLLDRVTFVEVEAPLENDDSTSSDLAEEKPSRVACHRGDMEVGEVGVGESLDLLKGIRPLPEAGAEDDGNFRSRKVTQSGKNFLNLIVEGHGHSF
ncbi:MAG: hypothetical protein BWY86_01308 [Candidatus Aminicenantes bacterium ADurb.Bin508]|nr:MAG: hypothetical protein BWY86_01308 [Candidatus Aminicenantes bacterium ADurb.Bin508]